jgi:predicted Co/Zn/Cd cation transporter (cation efflux family)
MTEFNPQQFGKLLLLVGLIISLAGGIIILLGYFGLFKLPGDLEVGSRNWRFYFPITSSIVISIILTLIFWLISYFRR